MYKELENWINQITQPRPELGNMPVCPFAKEVKFEVIVSNGQDIIPLTGDFEIVVYLLPADMSIAELDCVAKNYNQKFPNVIFLPDHKDRNTFINGVQTNNGKLNLLLCQPRASLYAAREKLKKSNYYSFWSSNYLKEILDH